MPVHGSTFEAWRPQTVVDSTKFWQGEEISNQCFCHMSPDMLVIYNTRSILRLVFRAVRWTRLARTFTLLIIKKTAMTSCSHLASSTNLYSLQAGYWSPGKYRIVCSLAGVSSPLEIVLLPVSSAFYLVMSVNLNYTGPDLLSSTVFHF